MSKITEMPKLPKETENFFNCCLFHSRIPKSRRVWSDEHKEFVFEIYYVCKEGCDNYKSEK